MALELAFLDFMQTHLRGEFLDKAVPLLTKLGDYGLLWIALAAVLLLIPKTRRAGAVLAVSLLLEVLLCNAILKPLVGRSRPYEVMNKAAELLILPPADYSFPSGHTCAAFTAASALFFSRNLLWAPSFIIAVLIGFSRLYLYVHYPSDVLAGALLGIVLGWLGNAIVRRLAERLGGK